MHANGSSSITLRAPIGPANTEISCKGRTGR